MLKKQKVRNSLDRAKAITNKTAKWTVGSLAGIFMASALTTGALYKFGEDIGTESYRDYAERNGMPMQIVDQSPVADEIRVFKDGTAGWLYKAGLFTEMEIDQAVAASGAEEGSFKSYWVMAASGSHSLVKNLSVQYNQHFNGHALGAYAMPGMWTPDKQCYIHPPGEIADLAELTYQITGIHPALMPQLQGIDDVDPKVPIMIHEASHCSNNMPRSIFDLYSPANTLKGEALSDSDIFSIFEEHYKVSIFPELWYHARAVSALSHPLQFGASHSTSALTNSPLNDDKNYSTEDIYAAYVHLNLLIKDMQSEIHPYFGLTEETGKDIYFLDTYVKVYYILNNDFDITDAARRAGELYMQGVEYLVPDVKNVDLSKVPVTKKPIEKEEPTFQERVNNLINHLG